MKKINKYIMVALMAAISFGANAQQVNTLYFLENAPMRHTINPAFQPVSKGYINFTPLGWMTISAGNNSLTVSDVLFKDNVPGSESYGKTITPLHPDADKQAFLKAYGSMLFMNTDLTLGLLNMGFQIKKKGFLTIGINERIQFGATLPRDIPEFLFNGGMKNLNGETNTFDIGSLSLGATSYTEIGVGYSHIINDKWTVGGKLKVLLGQVYGGSDAREFKIEANHEQWHFHGDMDLNIAAPLNSEYLSEYLDAKSIQQAIDGIKNGELDQNKLLNGGDYLQFLKPSGYGAAIDLGFTYKPIDNLQISAAVTDLGFIYWTKTNKFTVKLDTIYEGAGTINYGDERFKDENGNFSTGILMDTVTSKLKGILSGAKLSYQGNAGLIRMTTARLNVGVDANFWDNRVGVGILSATRLYNSRLYEEVTIGAAFRPVNWFNIAVSYSLLENGKYSNIGAGLGFMPYDGINLTLTMDYIPTSYAAMPNTKTYVIPDKTKQFNVALGFSICWGSNRRDKDKDGVYNKIDMCPNTPRGVKVDERGCPLDEDHDGVPDYLDQCLGTPAAAIGYVDSVGCELDTDGDGVEDYRDKCPNTPEAAWGKVDENGCPLDSDGDGVPDYLDECPETPEAAKGKIDEKGCPLDTDMDGVPDYMDACPDTPEESRDKVDENGCSTDTDGDGVPDFLDQCPDTPQEAKGMVDEKGCPIDSDEDGVPDYIDQCPAVPGLTTNKGCPEVKREVRQLLQKAMQGIEFESGKASIKKKSYALLDKIAQTFIENPNFIIEVQGHTDDSGDYNQNVKISEKRAKAVMDYLEKKGVATSRMTAKGYGPDKPIADNRTKMGRQKNRRVEFNITFEEVHVETILEHADEPVVNQEQVQE